MTHKQFVSAQDIEHVRLHVWELQQLVEKMASEENPETDRLKSLLVRFINGDPNKDRV